MVFPDISSENQRQNPQLSAPAHLMDRFFSFVIDYLVISPFVLFLVYLTFRNGFEFWRSHPVAPENLLFFMLSGVVYIAYFSFFQSLFAAFFHATPGQYFLKIRFDFGESHSFLFFRIFLRQFGFWLSFAFLGIPFLSVMTNRRRLTFYDRIADVAVISRKDSEIHLGFEKEYRYWQSFTVTLSLFVGFLFSMLVWQNYEKVVQRHLSFNAFQTQSFFCEVLEGVAASERLSTAVALNLVDQLSDECLDRESDFVLWRQKKGDESLAYYAKSLTAVTADKEKQYKQQACVKETHEDFEKMSLGCRVATAFLNDDTEKLYHSLTDTDLLSDVLRYELGIILNKPSDMPYNFAQISRHSHLKLVKKYQISELVWQMRSQEQNVPRRTPASFSDESFRTAPESSKVSSEINQQILDLLESM